MKYYIIKLYIYTQQCEKIGTPYHSHLCWFDFIVPLSEIQSSSEGITSSTLNISRQERTKLLSEQSNEVSVLTK